MSKAGEKLLGAIQEAIDAVRGEIGPRGFRVTPSCGCIFCDIGLRPTKMKRQYIHYIKRERKLVVCAVN